MNTCISIHRKWFIDYAKINYFHLVIHLSFNEFIVKSWQEVLLLNVYRGLHYRIYFIRERLKESIDYNVTSLKSKVSKFTLVSKVLHEFSNSKTSNITRILGNSTACSIEMKYILVHSTRNPYNNLTIVAFNNTFSHSSQLIGNSRHDERYTYEYTIQTSLCKNEVQGDYSVKKENTEKWKFFEWAYDVLYIMFLSRLSLWSFLRSLNFS